jgi:uncharacterized protein (TIGR04255 family)
VAEFSGRFSRAPILYALCEIRFARILKILSLVPDIQEKLRADYDGFEEEQIAGIAISGGATQPSVQSQQRWRFENAEQTSGYILHSGAIVFHTTDYIDFEHFVPEVIRGFDAVASTAKLSRITRIGLRYVDLIESEKDSSADELVHEQLRGFGSKLTGITNGTSQYIFNGSTNLGRLVFRTTRGQLGAPLPLELLPLSLSLKRSPDPTKVSILLDTDHIVDKPKVPFDELTNLLGELKAPISAAFKKAITQKAVDIWK